MLQGPDADIVQVTNLGQTENLLSAIGTGFICKCLIRGRTKVHEKRRFRGLHLSVGVVVGHGHVGVEVTG